MCHQCPSLLLTSVFAVCYCDTSRLTVSLHSELCENLLEHAHITDTREKKAVPGLLAVSTLFAHHNAILFSHDVLGAIRHHIKHRLIINLGLKLEH